MQRVHVWDLPVRLFHWLLVAGFCGAFAIAEFTDDDGPLFVLHMVLGLLVGLMTVLRVVWGLVGTRYARFREFTFQPKRLMGYFKGLLTRSNESYVGHNPATSYAALVIFAAALGLTASGLLMALGNAKQLKELHEVFAFGLLTVGGLHVAGVALHSFRYRDRIALSMLDGKKSVAPESAITSNHLGAALVMLLTLGAATTWLLSGYDQTTGSVSLPGTSIRFGAESDEKGDRQMHTGKRSARAHKVGHDDD